METGFLFSVESFYFSKCYGNEAKHDKSNIDRGLSKTFKVKNL